MKITEKIDQPDLQPVLTSFKWVKAQTSNGPYVVLFCSTPVGSNAYWMPPETAKTVGNGLLQTASGLYVAGKMPEGEPATGAERSPGNYL